MKDDPRRPPYVLGHGSEEHRRLNLQSRFVGELTEMETKTAHCVPDVPLYTQCGRWIVEAFTRAGVETSMGSRRPCAACCR